MHRVEAIDSRAVSEREPIAQDTAKGPPESDPRIEGEKHPVGRMMAIGVIASLIGIGISLLIDWFPEDASTIAGDIDTLYDVLLICSVPVFVLVMTIAIYSVVRFRAKPGDMGDGPPIHGNTKLEIIWVTVPFIMVTALAIYGWIVLDDIEAKQPNELVVNVTGQQFAWTFEYPQEKVNANELVLPLDRPVDFRIRTEDVIHSFWVPQFRLKSDTVPGLTTRVRVTPDRVGAWSVVCTELCGLGHSAMRANVRVVPEEEYLAWIEDQGEEAEAEGGGGGGGPAGATRAAADRAPAPRVSRCSPPQAAARATSSRPRAPTARWAPVSTTSPRPTKRRSRSRSSIPEPCWWRATATG